MIDCSDARKLLDFISASPSCFHVVSNMASVLSENGFAELDERKSFDIRPSGRYYVRRNGSSIIAFTVPDCAVRSAQIIAAHTDSPCFKLKPNPVDVSSGSYSTLNVETYGGLICSTWFDRPLSIAGRAFVRTQDGIEERLVDFNRDLVVMASLAIHQNREVNNGVKISVQKECRPIIAGSSDASVLSRLLSSQLGVDESDILDSDLFLYNRTPGVIWGADGEFISSGRLDDLMCSYSALRAICEAEDSGRLRIVSLFDNEEVGSSSRQGALSDFLATCFRRILFSLGLSYDEICRVQASSSMLSADNGHALHPNYSEKCDITNHPVVNGGVIVKYSANQKYTTDAVMGSYVRDLMQRRSIPFQIFVNNSDVTGGSTLGNLSAHQLSIPCADVGLAQLAMHSSWESAGVADCRHILDLFRAYLEDREVEHAK